MNRDDQTIRLISDPPFDDDSLIEIYNRFGSKIITGARLLDLTVLGLGADDKEHGSRKFFHAIDEEIAREN
jgi:hypothetical protein